MKSQHKRSKEEKEKIILDIQRIGSVAGCRMHGIAASLYYDWLRKYEAHGIEGLEDRRGKSESVTVKKLEKQVSILKEMLADRDLELRMKDELLKKKIAQWKRGSK